MITKNDLDVMKSVANGMVYVIRSNELKFKEDFIVPYSKFCGAEYDIDRVHFSGNYTRITIRFREDSTTHDIYEDIDKVFEWCSNILKGETL